MTKNMAKTIRPSARQHPSSYTIDGSEIQLRSWGKGSWNPIIYKVLAPFQVGKLAGFLNHQLYVWSTSHLERMQSSQMKV